MTNLVPQDTNLPAVPPVALDSYVDLLAKYSECARAIKYWQSELDRTKESLAQILGDSEEGTINGQTVFTYAKIERFNGTEFKKKYPDMYRLYTRDVTETRFDPDWLRVSRPELWAQFQVRTMRNEFSTG